MANIKEKTGIKGIVSIEVRNADGSLAERRVIENIITQVGDQYYAERAAGITSPPDQVTGMKLGEDGTAAAKTGAGAAIVGYLSGSNKAIDGGFPTSSLSGSARRITWQVSYGVGEAESTGIEEVALTNQTPNADDAGSAANTIARAVVSPPVAVTSAQTATVVWEHDVEGV